MAKKNTPATTQKPTTPRRRTKTASATTDASSHGGNDGVTIGPSPDEIAEAAYHRYLSRGAGDGRDFDDWVEAERELRRRRS